MTIKYDRNATVVPALEGRFVKLRNEELVAIPPRLAERVRQKELTAEELQAEYYPHPCGIGMYEASRFVEVEWTFVPNGNDVLLVDGVLIEFAPLVKVKTSLDMSYLVNNADGNILENSPMIDNHWMDEQAEREYSEMLNFANYVNA